MASHKAYALFPRGLLLLWWRLMTLLCLHFRDDPHINIYLMNLGTPNQVTHDDAWPGI